MWVYQQTGMPAHLPEAAQQLPTGEAVLLPQPQKTLPPERSAPEVPSPLQRHNTKTRQKTCWLLVCAFLIGSGSAGVLLAFCEKQQPDWLQYSLQSWRGLFAAADPHTAASLFGTEYLTLAASATLLLSLIHILRSHGDRQPWYRGSPAPFFRRCSTIRCAFCDPRFFSLIFCNGCIQSFVGGCVTRNVVRRMDVQVYATVGKDFGLSLIHI